MPHEYKAHQSAEDRKEAATQRIKEKIAVLELWERDGAPNGYEWIERDNPKKKHSCPINVSEFTKWNDVNLVVEVRIDGKKHDVNGVYHFSAVTLDKKERSALKERALELIASIKKRPAPKKELAKLRAELKVEKVFTRKLVNENAKLRNEIANHNEDLTEVLDRNKNLMDRVAELERELERAKKTHGLHPVK